MTNAQRSSGNSKAFNCSNKCKYPLEDAWNTERLIYKAEEEDDSRQTKAYVGCTKGKFKQTL